MVKKQVEVEILATNRHALLAGQKSEVGSKFQQETLDVAQNCCLQVPFTEGIRQPQEVEKVGIAKDQIWSHTIRLAELFEFPVDQCVRLPRNGRPLKEHAAN